MIDFHSHILPAIDDGAQDVYESLAMAKEAFLKGIDTIIATPHFIYEETLYTKEEVFLKVEALNQELQRENITVTILPGQEIYLTPEVPMLLKKNSIITLGGQGKYLLIELPMNDYPSYTESVLFEIMLQGVVPVIAHPERNKLLSKQPQKLFRLISKGVLSQINTGSFHGKYGTTAQQAAEIFIKYAYSQFIGYDAHDKDGYNYSVPEHLKCSAAETAFINNKYLPSNPIEMKKRKFLNIF